MSYESVHFSLSPLLLPWSKHSLLLFVVYCCGLLASPYLQCPRLLQTACLPQSSPGRTSEIQFWSVTCLKGFHPSYLPVVLRSQPNFLTRLRGLSWSGPCLSQELSLSPPSSFHAHSSHTKPLPMPWLALVLSCLKHVGSDNWGSGAESTHAYTCDFRQVIWLLWASVSLYVKWGRQLCLWLGC